MNKSIKRLLLMTALAGFSPLKSFADIFVSVSFAPPALPVYEQPACPAEGYLWTPGYWAFADGAYYWVPGTWVLAPMPGLLWTPGYWGYEGAAYFWHAGYWAPHVGFYGGINYGYGYSGAGYQGGYWNNNVFNYNRTVNNVSVTKVYNTYYSPVINNQPANHVAYDGGAGGLMARPLAQDQLAMRETHYRLTGGQLQNETAARANPLQRVTYNHGYPGVFATPTPAAFREPGVVREAGNESQPAPQPAFRQQAQQRTPEYHYEQQAPAPYRQPASYQAPPASGNERTTTGAQTAAPGRVSAESRPQAWYPPTMAQRYQQTANPRNNASMPGDYRQTSERAPAREPAIQAHQAQAQQRGPAASAYSRRGQS